MQNRKKIFFKNTTSKSLNSFILIRFIGKVVKGKKFAWIDVDIKTFLKKNSFGTINLHGTVFPWYMNCG